MENALTQALQTIFPEVTSGPYLAIRPAVREALAAERPSVALGLLQSIETLASADPDYILDRARAHWALDDIDVAVRLMTLAVEVLPTDAERWGRLGSMYLSLNQRDAAATALSQASRLAPNSASILAALNRASPFTHTGPEARRLRRIAGSAKAPMAERAMAENALARIEDAAGRTKAAFRHALRAKARVVGRYDPAAMARHVAAQEKVFKPAETVPSQSGPRVVFVVGLPRSGTTLMESILDRHPQVHGIGESRALPEALALCRKERLTPQSKSGWDWLPRLSNEDRARYGAMYLARATERFVVSPEVIVDKLPLNALEIGFAAQVLPNACFIHMSRHPLDVALSNLFAHYRDANAFSKRMAWIANLTAIVARSAEDYAAKLGPMFRYQSYHALVTRPEEQIRQVISHAGLDWDPGCLSPEAGRRVVRTASITQVQSGINRKGLGKWRRYEAELAPLVVALGGASEVEGWQDADLNGRLYRFRAAETGNALPD